MINSGAIGLPIEFVTRVGKNDRHDHVINQSCARQEHAVTRKRPVPSSSPTRDNVLTVMPPAGARFSMDFTRTMPKSDIDGNTVGVVFVELRTMFCYGFLLKGKDGFFDALEDLTRINLIRTGVNITHLYGDSDTMWFKPGSRDPHTAKMKEFMEKHGTNVFASEAEVHQQNLAGGGMMRKIMAIMYAQVVHARLAVVFWGPSFRHAIDVCNVRPIHHSARHMPTPGGTPFEAYTGQPPDYSLFFVFGATTRVLVHGSKPNQMKRTYREGIWEGVSWQKGPSWWVRILDDMSLVSAYHIAVNQDMTYRSIRLSTHDNLLSNSTDGVRGGISSPMATFNQGIRDLFQSSKDNATFDKGFIVFSPLTNMPVNLVPCEDENGDLIIPMEHYEALPDEQGSRVDLELGSDEQPAISPPSPKAAPATRAPSVYARLKSLPHSTRIEMRKPNPKTKMRGGAISKSWQRYERYMHATTIGQFLQLTTKPKDLEFDYENGFLTLTEPGVALALIPPDFMPVIASVGSANHSGTASIYRPTDGAHDSPRRHGQLDTSSLADRAGLTYSLARAARLAEHDGHGPGRETGKWGGGQGGGAPPAAATAEGQEQESYTVNESDLLNSVTPADPVHQQYIEDAHGLATQDGRPLYLLATSTNTIADGTPSRIGNDINAQLAAYTHDDPVQQAHGPADASATAAAVSDTTARHADLIAAAKQVSEDITGTPAEHLNAGEDLVNLIAASIDEKLKSLGPDAPALENLSEFIAAAMSNDAPSYARAAEHDPETMKEMLESKARRDWVLAMLKEWVSLSAAFKAFGDKPVPLKDPVRRRRNGERIRIIPMKWVWKLKDSGRYKARLVACEAVGRFDMPSIEKWSPTVGQDSVRLFFIIAVQLGLEIVSIDVSNAYLVGTRPASEPDVYLTLPPGLDLLRAIMIEKGLDPGPLLNYRDENGWVNCFHLKGNLYGTQTAGRTFWRHARDWLLKLGFKQATPDPCIFRLTRDDGSFMLIALYVDDALLAFSSEAVKLYFFKEFEAEFDQSPDSGDPVYIGISYRVHGDGSYISLNTPRLWSKLRERMDGIELPKVRTPLPKNAMKLLYAEVSEDNPIVPTEVCNVRELLGLVSWAVHAVRPGELMSTSLLARRAHIPTKNVVVLLYHLISYLLDHSEDEMHIVKDNEPPFRSAVDSSFANCPETGRSWFGYTFIWGGIAFVFRSKLQPFVAPSTRDAEIAGIVYAVKGMVAVLILLSDLDLAPDGITPLTLDVDSQAALANMHTEWIHKDSRWNSIRIRFVRDLVRALIVKGRYIDTKEMMADCLTKVPSSGIEHGQHRNNLMGVPPTWFTDKLKK